MAISLRRIYESVYQQMIKHRFGVAWLLSFFVVILALAFYHFDIFARLELMTLDLRFNLRHPVPKAADIVFIDMAEDSIEAIGRWPWPRKWHAALIKAISPHRPRAIGFDVIFSEPQDETDDLALEEALKEAGVVYMPCIYDIEGQQRGELDKGIGVTAIYEPIPAFRSAIRGTGHINAVPDIDGILRRIPAIISFDGKPTYQFGMKIAFDLLGAGKGDVTFDRLRHVITVKLPDGKTRNIPLDRENQMIVNWMGQWGQEFPHYSFIDVITSYIAEQEGRKPVVDLEVFRGKICIVGLTATGLFDIKPIPVQNAYPAVGTNAMAVYGLLTGDFLREAPAPLNMAIIAIVSILATLVLCNLRVLSGVVFTITGSIIYLLVSAGIFSVYSAIVTTVYPVVGIIGAYVLTASYSQILQSIERTRLFTQATRDGLTHLFNIRHFNMLLEAEFKNAALYKFRRLSVLMADLDNFKHLNDTYGHQTGDTVLREVAHTIQAKCRQMDVAARYGGEEFIAMLAGAAAKDAAEIGERIRAAVEAKKFKAGSESFSVTVSIGIVEYSNEKDKDELVGKADKALYRAKHEGKNKVCIYPDG